jgi:hypothetical protein
MTRKKKTPPSSPPAAQPGLSGAGHEVRPEAVPATNPSEAPGGAVPIGLPIPLEQYEALQKDLKRRKPAHPDIAQDDAARGGDT